MFQNIIEVLILSAIQGVSEFLPISSSAHLIIVSSLYEFKSSSLLIDISLHLGSLFAIIFFFREELLDIKGMVVEELTKDKTLLNEIFLTVGEKEFKFIEKSGIYFGFIFGVIQMVIWYFVSDLSGAWTLLPIGGVVRPERRPPADVGRLGAAKRR